MEVPYQPATDLSNATSKPYYLTCVNENVTCELFIEGGTSVAYQSN